VIDELVVSPGAPADLEQGSTAETKTDWLGQIGRSSSKDVAEHDLDLFKQELESAQELLYASDHLGLALLIIFQALDAAGKDGTIKHVMSGVNPQGCQVFSFKQPSVQELRHDFLWRCATALPERGRIGIFNRSYYEEVLVVRVHPELIAAQHLPPGTQSGPRLWKQRYEDINAFERHLVRNGTRLVKFFLHVSRDEQRRRFLDRLDDRAKQWSSPPPTLQNGTTSRRINRPTRRRLRPRPPVGHRGTSSRPTISRPCGRSWAASSSTRSTGSTCTCRP
jgi:PPK2 family polyphosphate:nucleotide phosphotransferase